METTMPDARNHWLGRGLAALLVGTVAGAVAMRSWMIRPAAQARPPIVASEKSVGAHDHEGHAAHGEEEGVIHLPPDAMQTYGIEFARAEPGKLERTITLPGEVRLNADRVAHIVPRVAGMVREVHKNLGDSVAPGELIAVLDSRELADAKAADLAAASRHALAKASLDRVEKLFAQKIGPEEDLLRARQLLVETDIDHRTAEAKLHALGLTQEQVENLHQEKDTDYSRYEMKAPFAGTVIEKHITLGEVVNSETSSFVLADLSDVWVEVTVYLQDMAHVTVGRPVSVTAVGVSEPQRGEISYLGPRISERTRTGLARAVLSNPDGRWKPGMFVSAELAVSAEDVAMLVPNSALQTIENQAVVFVAAEGGFAKREVTVGRSTGTHSEVLSGLAPGEIYAATGTFILKAELGKAEAEHAH